MRRQRNSPSNRIPAHKRPYFTTEQKQLIQDFLGAALAEAEHCLKGAKLLAKGSKPGTPEHNGKIYWKNVCSAVAWLFHKSNQRQTHLAVKAMLEQQAQEGK